MSTFKQAYRRKLLHRWTINSKGALVQTIAPRPAFIFALAFAVALLPLSFL